MSSYTDVLKKKDFTVSINKINHPGKPLVIKDERSWGPFVRIGQKHKKNIYVTAFFNDTIKDSNIYVLQEPSTAANELHYLIKLDKPSIDSDTQNLWEIGITLTKKTPFEGIEKVKVVIDYNYPKDIGEPKRGTIVIPPK